MSTTEKAKTNDNLYYQQANKALAEAKTKLTAQAAEKKAALNSDIDSQIAAAEQQTAASIADTDRDYRALVDTTAVQRELNRRRISESMANLGLSRSGLNVTQQTAVELSAGNTLSAAQRQRQAAVDTLRRALSEYKREAETTRLQSSNEIDAAVETSLSDYQTKLYNAAADATSADNATTANREVELAKITAETESERRQSNEAALKTLYSDGCISPTVYAAALESGTTVGQLAAQNIIRASGTYTAKPATTTTSKSSSNKDYSSTLKTLLSNGDISASTYAVSTEHNLPPTQALEYEKQQEKQGSENSDSNNKETPWTWSATAYRKTGTDTANGFLGMGTWFGNIDKNDTVEYYDQTGNRRTITLGDLYTNLLSEGMSSSEAKSFVTRFNKNSTENTTYFLTSTGSLSYATTVRSFVDKAYASAGIKGATAELEAAYQTGYIDEQVYQTLGEHYGVKDSDIIRCRADKSLDKVFAGAYARYKSWEG